LLERVRVNDVGFRNFNRWTIPLALAFLLAANFFLWILQMLIAGGSPTSFADIESILPHTSGEKIFWVILTAVVAVNEELTFRGYLISRISRLAGGRTWVGVLISSLAFASGHVYQGSGGFVLIFIYGLMFSLLYVKTGSIYPGIIAHFIQDAIVAIIPGLAH
jgi:membrane protease YdiL (CAAX protease family)